MQQPDVFIELHIQIQKSSIPSFRRIVTGTFVWFTSTVRIGGIRIKFPCSQLFRLYFTAGDLP